MYEQNPEERGQQGALCSSPAGVRREIPAIVRYVSLSFGRPLAGTPEK